MQRLSIGLCLIILYCAFLPPGLSVASNTLTSEAPQKESSRTAISVADDVGNAMRREMGRMSEQFQQQAISLFERTPLEWDAATIDFLYQWCLALPFLQ